MTNKERERLSDQASSEMAKMVRDGYDKKALPDHPTNVDTINAFIIKWKKKLDDKLKYIEYREKNKHYDNNPDDFKKDWEEAYYARFIIHLDEDDWREYLK